MKTRTQCHHRFAFDFPDLKTRVLVEELEDAVLVRASRDTFSGQRKASFVRELAAEGFIADSYQSFSESESKSSLELRWLVDDSCVKPTEDLTVRTNRFMVRLFVCSALLWLGMMATQFLRMGQ